MFLACNCPSYDSRLIIGSKGRGIVYIVTIWHVILPLQLYPSASSVSFGPVYMLVFDSMKSGWRLSVSRKPLQPTWMVCRLACLPLLCATSNRWRYLLSFLNFELGKLMFSQQLDCQLKDVHVYIHAHTHTRTRTRTLTHTRTHARTHARTHTHTHTHTSWSIESTYKH